ncbi:MAG: HEAT repeat domain-containing protein [Planctomycetota bacterium]|nr:HEAT repeat domain-containing protein [Planctomycetota bacterium]
MPQPSVLAAPVRTTLTAALALACCLLPACGDKQGAARVDGKSREFWMDRLAEASPASKAAALAALARFDDPPIDLIAANVDADARTVRVAAIEALGAIGPAAVGYAKTMAPLLEDPPEGGDEREAKALREAAMEALGRLGSEAFASFSYMLVNENPAHRARAVYTIRPFVKALPDGVNTVLPLVADDNAVVRREAAKTLGVAAEKTNDRRASDVLIEALTDPDPGVVAAAATALGSVGGSSDREGRALSKLLYAHRQEVRASAAFGLGLMGVEAQPYMDELRDLLRNDNRPLVRIQASRAHFRISGSAEYALPQLEKDVASSDAGLCRDALRAIGELGPAAAPAVNSVIPYLEIKLMRGTAAETLAAIGPGARDALPFLAKAAEATEPNDPDRAEIARAEQAIRGE